MGNQSSHSNKINYEDVQFILQHSSDFVLINTLDVTNQQCLISTTVDIYKEEEIINQFISMGKKEIPIVIYGENCNDEKLHSKYTQLKNLGFNNIYLYTGGLFEWLLLQDIYGEKEFPTTKKQLDILKYTPVKILNLLLLK